MCIIPRFLLQCLFDSQVGEHLFCMLLSQRIRESIILVFLDFPYWVRFAHFINLIFITLLIRSGIEILSALPKLYFNDHAKPGSEWIKFTKKKMPQRQALDLIRGRGRLSVIGLLYQDTGISGWDGIGIFFLSYSG